MDQVVQIVVKHILEKAINYFVSFHKQPVGYLLSWPLRTLPKPVNYLKELGSAGAGLLEHLWREVYYSKLATGLFFANDFGEGDLVFVRFNFNMSVPLVEQAFGFGLHLDEANHGMGGLHGVQIVVDR